jgi:23S rRNA-/tRNA-specific pseudouridylate synthase
MEWLQWVLIPRMHQLLESEPLPQNFAVAPYYEMALDAAHRCANPCWRSCCCWMRCLPVRGLMLEIIYQDDWLVAVNKPSGWLVHRSWLDRDEKVVVMQTVRDQIGQHVFTAHRLDSPTSGVLLMGLSSEAGRRCRSSLSSIRSRSATMRSCAAG